jgi:GMP synthase-like glutamine amidotransferase
MPCLQWHGAEVKQAPIGMQVLSSSDKCSIQSLSSGTQVFSMQYHQETIASTVSEWSAIPAYKTALETALGEGAVENLEQTVMEYMLEFNNTARQLYNNWKSTILKN